MPRLSKSSGECCVALPTYKAIDGTPLMLNRLTRRLPESLLLFDNFFLHTIDVNKLKSKTYIFFFVNLQIDFLEKVLLFSFNFDSLIIGSDFDFPSV